MSSRRKNKRRETLKTQPGIRATPTLRSRSRRRRRRGPALPAPRSTSRAWLRTAGPCRPPAASELPLRRPEPPPAPGPRRGSRCRPGPVDATRRCSGCLLRLPLWAPLCFFRCKSSGRFTAARYWRGPPDAFPAAGSIPSTGKRPGGPGRRRMRHLGVSLWMGEKGRGPPKSRPSVVSEPALPFQHFFGAFDSNYPRNSAF
ncbi:uncharacterized protein LOC119707114 [Motacilla alba alba]|uniref:uncharacterized protein LOC119707114 n=1 Tax=Motacilla alba alba TaxID=1094192 RepID=UPI0018D584CE|nr:uncharacterized protein LOC119707114 [Motacilla alba alba]